MLHTKSYKFESCYSHQFMKTFHTFQEWSNAGFKIIKGSKSTFKNGKHLFSEDQVERKRFYPEPDNHFGGDDADVELVEEYGDDAYM